MNIEILLLLIWIHFVMDFVFQSNNVALNKSKNNAILLQHVTIYAIPLFLFNFWFGLVNAALHFVVDWVTSRCTHYFWSCDKRHWFFVTIGIDQAIHLTCLILTYIWLIK